MRNPSLEAEVLKQIARGNRTVQSIAHARGELEVAPARHAIRIAIRYLRETGQIRFLGKTIKNFGVYEICNQENSTT